MGTSLHRIPEADQESGGRVAQRPPHVAGLGNRQLARLLARSDNPDALAAAVRALGQGSSPPGQPDRALARAQVGALARAAAGRRSSTVAPRAPTAMLQRTPTPGDPAAAAKLWELMKRHPNALRVVTAIAGALSIPEGKEIKLPDPVGKPGEYVKEAEEEGKRKRKSEKGGAAGPDPDPLEGKGTVETAAPQAKGKRTSPPPPAQVPPHVRRRMEARLNDFAKMHRWRVKRQGGFARIGAMNFIAIAGAGGIVLLNEDRLDAALELAKETAKGAAVTGAGALLGRLLGVGSGVGAIATMVLGMESDNPAHNERMAKQRMIDALIWEAFPGVQSSRDRWCLGWCTEWDYEVKNPKQYLEIFAQVEYIVDNPHEVKREPPRYYDLGELTAGGRIPEY
jgi:hypothetical protein